MFVPLSSSVGYRRNRWRWHTVVSLCLFISIIIPAPDTFAPPPHRLLRAWADGASALEVGQVVDVNQVSRPAASAGHHHVGRTQFTRPYERQNFIATHAPPSGDLGWAQLGLGGGFHVPYLSLLSRISIYCLWELQVFIYLYNPETSKPTKSKSIARCKFARAHVALFFISAARCGFRMYIKKSAPERIPTDHPRVRAMARIFRVRIESAF